MNKRQLKALEAAGWKSGTIQELLDLSDEDMEIIEIRLVNTSLWKGLRKVLDELSASQAEVTQLREALGEIALKHPGGARFMASRALDD